MDIVVLACTHFPLVQRELEQVSPQPLQFMDGGDGIARRIAFLTDGQPWPDKPVPGKAVFTGCSDDVEKLSAALAERGLDSITYL